MSEIIVVLGPAGRERDGVRKSVALDGGFTVIAGSSLAGIRKRVTDFSRVTCVLQLQGGGFDARIESRPGAVGGQTGLHLLVETKTTSDSWLREGLRQGASAVVSWPVAAGELRAALTAARRGAAGLTPTSGGILAGRVGEPGANRPPPEPALTLRERETARQLCAGHTNKEIADALGIAESTVETHLTHIYQKVGAQSRTEAIVRFLGEHGAGHATAAALSPSELRVAERVLRGQSNKDIAAEINLSESAVESHLTHAYHKLGVRNRAELLAKYSSA